MAGKAHHDIVGGKEKIRIDGSSAPHDAVSNWSGRWHMSGRSGACPSMRPLRVNAGCKTDTKPHRTLVLQWMRDKLSADVVCTRFGNSDSALERRAADIYCKMRG